jgi:hypothetical protein
MTSFWMPIGRQDSETDRQLSANAIKGAHGK